jgi:ribosome recycling factor
MQKTLDVLGEEYASIRVGRANPHLLDKLKVDYYGAETPITGVANISVPEARILQIQPWEPKMAKDIEKAILASDLGITPNSDGRVIRLIFPELTEERRKEISKDIKKKGEGAKVAVRNIRRDANEHFKKSQKAAEISEDEFADLEDDMQKVTDKYAAKIDALAEAKTKEIMTV